MAYNYPDLEFWQGKRTLKFYIARIARVMPLYWLMIAYCAAYYFVVSRHQYPWPLIQNILAIQTWSGDLLVAQSYYNAPGWSIGVEMFFYLLFPFLIPFVARLARKHGARGLIALIAAMFLIVVALWVYFYLSGRTALLPADPRSGHRWLYRNPLCYLPVFGCGMAIAFLIPHVHTWSLRLHHMLQAAVFVYVFGLAMFRGIGPGWDTASYGLFFVIPFVVALLTLASDRGWLARFLATAPMLRLGVASYALYITHRWLVWKMPAYEQIEKGRDLIPYVSLLIVLVLLLLIAEGAHQYVEEPARRWIVNITRNWTTEPPTPADPFVTVEIPAYREPVHSPTTPPIRKWPRG